MICTAHSSWFESNVGEHLKFEVHKNIPEQCQLGKLSYRYLVKKYIFHILSKYEIFYPGLEKKGIIPGNAGIASYLFLDPYSETGKADTAPVPKFVCNNSVIALSVKLLPPSTYFHLIKLVCNPTVIILNFI